MTMALERKVKMIKFRPALDTEAKPIIGLYSESGCGKTMSALLLACGFVDGAMDKVLMIETESGRGEAFARDEIVGGYQVAPLRDSFSPAHFGEAIRAAAKANFRALIIDTASHEWEGTGGVLDMASKNQDAGMKGVLAWQKPKMSHQKDFVLPLMQTPIPLVIVCMRARYPMVEEEVRDRQGQPKKQWTRSNVLVPKQSEEILFEMFTHGWIDAEHNFHVTKHTLQSFSEVFIDGKPIDVETGRRIAAWSKGAAEPGAAAPPAPSSGDNFPSSDSESGDAAADLITVDQAIEIVDRLGDASITEAAFCKASKVQRVSSLKAKDYERALNWIDRAKEKVAS